MLVPVIAHIADVHIRGGTSRHDEYKKTFLEFAKSCRENGVDHIFIAGDVFHTKTSGITPEYIDFMKWWFDLLTSVGEVHVMLGNHDGNLVNQGRQDAITPIVTALDNSKIHLYKKSGVYQFAPGFNFCVFSLFDEEGWKDVKPVPGEFNIACYHGAVWGAKTDADWELEGDLKVDFFKDYTCTLLGDIHKFQFLDTRDYEFEIDANDLHLYPGAIILEEIE